MWLNIVKRILEAWLQLSYAMFFLFQFVTLCSFCGPIDGVSSLSYVCNYQPSDDCKTYDDIKHGSCMDCS